MVFEKSKTISFFKGATPGENRTHNLPLREGRSIQLSYRGCELKVKENQKLSFDCPQNLDCNSAFMKSLRLSDQMFGDSFLGKRMHTEG